MVENDNDEVVDVAVVVNGSQDNGTIGFLILSSVIGILIGDLLWLQALSILGTVRVIFIDALKPFCATLFDVLVFHSSGSSKSSHYYVWILFGITLTVGGILCMSFEHHNQQQKQRQQDDEEKVKQQQSGCDEPPNIEEHGKEMEEEISIASKDVLNASHDEETSNDNRTTDISATSDRTSLPTTTTKAMSMIENISNNTNGSSIDTTTNTKKQTNRSKTTIITIGYGMSFTNVLLDTYGSVLTKQYGIAMSVWEINAIRFGFAGIVLLCTSIGLILYETYNKNDTITTLDPTVLVVPTNAPDATHDTIPIHENNNNNHAVAVEDNIHISQSSNLSHGCTMTTNTATRNISNGILEVTHQTTSHLGLPIASNAMDHNDINKHDSMDKTTSPTVPSTISSWYRIPITDPTITKSVWVYITLGVMFVTYIAPTLYNYALFEIPFALTLTLTSIGPFYAVPVSYLVQQYRYCRSTTVTNQNNASYDSNSTKVRSPVPKPQRPTILAWVGAILTVSGIVVLAYTGQ
jgi:uncharacterized membrane protein